MLKNIDSEALNDFYEAVLTLKTPEECDAFFRDVCTVQELASVSQRYKVARMLNDKKVYTEIVAKVGASTATISRVNRTLTIDGKGGYEIVFNRLKDNGDTEI